MLDWKTDWKVTDNYARNGIQDVERLINNCKNLASRILTKYGVNVNLETITLNGYDTVPYVEFLNQIENNIAKLFSPSQLPTLPFKTTWQAGGAAPMYADINRWEENGRTIDTLLG